MIFLIKEKKLFKIKEIENEEELGKMVCGAIDGVNRLWLTECFC
jgi:hypothetical protein